MNELRGGRGRNPARATLTMSEERTGLFGPRLGRHLNMRSEQILGLEREGQLCLAVTRVSSPDFDRPRSTLIDPEPAFSILFQMRDLHRHECWCGDAQRFTGGFGAGTVSVMDLRENPQCRFVGPFEALQFYVPRQALDAFAREHDARPIERLSWRRDSPDPVLASLSKLLLAAAERPDGNRLFLDQIAMSLLTHFAEAYGGLRAASAPQRGGLSGWQERRAMEIMRAGLAEELTIADIARECRLTPNHFARAFRQSTGRTPHRFLTELRVEEAKRLLARPELRLAEIAQLCGFGDQSHFTRVFGRHVGMSPGAWRRAHGPAR